MTSKRGSEAKQCDSDAANRQAEEDSQSSTCAHCVKWHKCGGLTLASGLAVVGLRPVFAKIVLFEKVLRERSGIRIQAQGVERHLRAHFESDAVVEGVERIAAPCERGVVMLEDAGDG